MVLSIPFNTSTTPGIRLIASATCRRPFVQQGLIRTEQLDLDRFRRAGKIPDHVLQQLDKFNFEHRVLLSDPGPSVPP